MREMLPEHPACCESNFTIAISVKYKEFISQSHKSTADVKHFFFFTHLLKTI